MLSPKQVSNFLLFQMAYTELFFVDKYWPDITRADVLDIFEAYKARERRYVETTPIQFVKLLLYTDRDY